MLIPDSLHLITTLPNITQKKLITRMFYHPLVSGVRYNVGTRSPYSPKETLTQIIDVASDAMKNFWIDLKGRQLRIVQWADPTYGDIVLNHAIQVDLPATIVFRGGTTSNVVAVHGNKIYVEPNPPEALGAGQAVNIIGTNLRIEGFLTEEDKEFILAGKELGIHDLMLSFVESELDLLEVLALNPNAKMVLKIESLAGLAFIDTMYMKKWPNCRLMAARDDLLVNIGINKAQILPAIRSIIKVDSRAIAASHIMTSLERGTISAADFSDLFLLYTMGYRNFMLSDGISHRYFETAIKYWQDFLGIITEV